MAETTGIQWTDSTWNIVTGCTRVGPGCAHCYIERTPPFRMQHRRFATVGTESTTGVTLHWDRLDKVPRGPKIFTPSLGDLFHEDVPDDFLDVAFAVMALHDDRVFQVLTKRPERARVYFTDPGVQHRIASRAAHRREDGDNAYDFVYGRWPIPQLWLGVSIENARFTWRADVLRETRAAVRFVSAEPLLDSLYPETFECPRCEGQRYDVGSCFLCANRGRLDDRGTRDRMPLDLTGIDWLIAGGESGPKSRGCDLAWIRELRDACAATGTAFFCKQLGANAYEHLRPDLPHLKFAAEIRDRKGGDIAEFPADLRIREFPRSAVRA